MSPALPGALSAPLSQDRFQPVTVSLWAKVGAYSSRSTRYSITKYFSRGSGACQSPKGVSDSGNAYGGRMISAPTVGLSAGLAAGIGVGPVRQAQQIIHADAVVGGQSDENVRGNHSLSAFIISIGALRNVDSFADFALCFITIFPQIADSLVFLHIHHQVQYMEEQFVLLTF